VLALAVSPNQSDRLAVLIVEDHDDTRAMYATFLSPLYDVLEAHNGARALDIIRERVPALVITDLSLPGMDGFELVARIRALPQSSDVPVICLSGFDGKAHEERAREAGVDRVLSKPCLPDELARAAAEVVGTRRGRA
jgi:CheY-like chemotaxis protein